MSRRPTTPHHGRLRPRRGPDPLGPALPLPQADGRGRGRTLPRRDRLPRVEPRPGRRWALGRRGRGARGPAPAPPRPDRGLPGRFPETLAVPDRGHRRPARGAAPAGTRLLALTNWSARAFPHAGRGLRLPRLFEGIVVSGDEGVGKPDPACSRSCSTATPSTRHETVFIDDSPANVAAAAAAGLGALLFTGPDQLRPRPQPARVCSTVPDQADPVAHGQHHAPRPGRRPPRGR